MLYRLIVYISFRFIILLKYTINLHRPTVNAVNLNLTSTNFPFGLILYTRYTVHTLVCIRKIQVTLWHIPRYPTRYHCITTIYHSIPSHTTMAYHTLISNFRSLKKYVCAINQNRFDLYISIDTTTICH